MSTIGFVLHRSRSDAHEIAEREINRLVRAGHNAHIIDDVVAGNGSALLDLVVSLGGDGTMLRALDMIGARETPVLGVNLGHLGYLSEVEPEQLSAAINAFFAGKTDIVPRMVLSVSITADGKTSEYLAMNEVVIERASSAAIRLRVGINGEPFLTYALDAMIVATPTGSTAYNLSARGPILSPSLDAIVLTPVSPHMVFDRAVVLDAGAGDVVELNVESSRSVSAVVDGRVICDLIENDTVVCQRSEVRARFVTYGGHSYRHVLTEKFGVKDR